MWVKSTEHILQHFVAAQLTFNRKSNLPDYVDFLPSIQPSIIYNLPPPSPAYCFVTTVIEVTSDLLFAVSSAVSFLFDATCPSAAAAAFTVPAYFSRLSSPGFPCGTTDHRGSDLLSWFLCSLP